MRDLLSFCANFARIIKKHPLINKITFKRQIGINSICKRSLIFIDFPPSNIVKLENVGPTLSNLRPLLLFVRSHNSCKQLS